MNSRDLCMIDHLPELMAAGVDSFKIEGRAKSAYYAAIVTGAYRHCIDAAVRGEAPIRCGGTGRACKPPALFYGVLFSVSRGSIRKAHAISVPGKFAPLCFPVMKQAGQSFRCAINLPKG